VSALLDRPDAAELPELRYVADPRGVTNCPRCGALTRLAFHDCDAFIARRARLRYRPGWNGSLDDVAEIEHEVAARRRGESDDLRSRVT
jgi:hypothetical protein